MKKKYKVAIIGAGRISCGFDSINDNHYLTHCHSIKDIDELEIIGIFDIDKEKVKSEAKKWNLIPYFNLNILLNKNPEIILIAVPNKFHEEYLIRLIRHKPALVVCEKPLTNSISTSKSIIENYKKNKIPITVCYQRRFDDEFLKIKKNFEQNKLGGFITGTVVYSKGILHNGSHSIDILMFLFGEIIKVKPTNSKVDYNPNDPTVSACISFECGDIHLIAADERFHSIFEIDLIFEKKRFRFTDSGNYLEVFEVKPDPFYNGYYAFSRISSDVSSLNYALKNMWIDIVKYLNTGKELNSTGLTALKTQNNCDKILKSIS